MKMLTKKIVDCIYVNKIIEQDMIAVFHSFVCHINFVHE